MATLSIKLAELMNDIAVWQELTNIKKAPAVAFDIRQYWKDHINKNTQTFTEEHKALLLGVGGDQQADGSVKIPDDLSQTKEDKLNKDFKALCDKEIKIPTMRLTLRDLMRACKDPVSEALLDGMEKYCRPEPKKSAAAKKKKADS